MSVRGNAGTISFSLVIPAYNEAERIPATLAEIIEYLDKQRYRSEIVVVDDGSSDRTFEAVQEVAAKSPVEIRLLRYERNTGKGHALKVGFEAARGERIGFSDADLSTPIEELSRLLAELDRGFDVVIGTRKKAGARIAVPQPWYREWMGSVYTYIVRFLIANVSDVTCGFKVYSGAPGRDLFSRVRIFDWSFDAELLLLARRLGYRIEEVPVQWHDEEGTKVRLGRDVLASLGNLLRIRWNGLRGKYDEPVRSSVPTTVWTAPREAGELGEGK